MKKTVLITVLLILIIMIFSDTVIAKRHDNPIEPKRQKTWTIMVYMDGDNNLEGAAIGDINEMEYEADTTQYHIVVTIDRIPGYDNSNGNWTDTRDYYIVYDPIVDGIIRSELIYQPGELNMGDPVNLVDFVTYYMTVLPATYYCVILWDHGNGWYKDGFSKDPLFKGIGGDWTSNNDCIEVAYGEYYAVLQAIYNYYGYPIDILGHDACLMGMHEVVYEAKDFADILVFSEHTEPGYGYPYDEIIGWLYQYPNMTPAEFTNAIVYEYIQSYMPGGSQYQTEYSATQSAVISSECQYLSQWIDTFAVELMDIGGIYNSSIQIIRELVQEYPDYNTTHIDLYHFAEMVKNTPSFPPLLKECADSVMATIMRYVTVEGHYTVPNGHDVDNSHGIAIYYPKDYQPNDTTYSWLLFEDDYPNWWLFLQGYSRIENQEISKKNHLPSLTISPNPAVKNVLLQCRIPNETNFVVDIYDVSGRLVKNLFNGNKKSGKHSFTWNRIDNKGNKVSNGTYFIKTKGNGFALTEKVILIR